MTDEKQPEDELTFTPTDDEGLETAPKEEKKEEPEEETVETPDEEKKEETEAPAEEEPKEEVKEKPADSTHDDFLAETAAPSPDTVNPDEKPEEEKVEEPSEETEVVKEEVVQDTHIYALRTTANREDQVLSFVGSNAARKKIPVHAVIMPHGMRGYVFVEADDLASAEQAAQGVPYAKGVIAKEINYKEIEHMLEQVKKDIKMQKNDIVEIISGPFKREKAKIARVDKSKEEVVVELLEAAVPIPITLKLDDVKVIRREEE